MRRGKSVIVLVSIRRTRIVSDPDAGTAMIVSRNPGLESEIAALESPFGQSARPDESVDQQVSEPAMQIRHWAIGFPVRCEVTHIARAAGMFGMIIRTNAGMHDRWTIDCFMDYRISQRRSARPLRTNSIRSRGKMRSSEGKKAFSGRKHAGTVGDEDLKF
jgi:hypothetical protein